MSEVRSDLARNTLGVLFIGGLILAAFWVLRPFIGPAIWATTIVVATWPLMKRLEARLWRRRLPAVLGMTLALLLLFVVPVTLAIITLVHNADDIVETAKQLARLRMPTPPVWIASLPLVGPKIVLFWEEAATAGTQDLWPKVQPYAVQFARWLVAEAGTVGFVMLQGLLVVALAAIMYAQGETAADMLLRMGRRLGGKHGEDTVILAGQAIRGVALGVGVTAVVQSVLGGIGLAIAGVPFAGILTIVMFVLCLAQVGPLLVLIPAVVWLYWSGDSGLGTFLLVVSVVVATLDNILRPMLIRMGADLPLLLIFVGVIGGLLAFGLVGIFVGPVVLAVAYTLMQAWVAEGEKEPPPPPERIDPV
ncbi:MAG: AI-2E family transporter YdiK [Burkholderiales bacterium]|nr:AI-2E family transporter YdiK [Burkholderiales bacterium]